jgi:hypothetical protein
MQMAWTDITTGGRQAPAADGDDNEARREEEIRHNPDGRTTQGGCHVQLEQLE